MTKTILAVDDSPSIRQMVHFTLKGGGYEVVEAVDGQDGLEKACRRQASLVCSKSSMGRPPHRASSTRSSARTAHSLEPRP